MPRLLPGLIAEIQRVRAKAATGRKGFEFLDKKTKTKDSITTRPIIPTQSFSFRGRRESILLDAVNPVLHRERFSHKKLALRKPSIPQNASQKEDEQQQTMSLAERGFSSNPYLRMLSSSIRQCSLTAKYLPIDFMTAWNILDIVDGTVAAVFMSCVVNERLILHARKEEEKLIRIPYTIKIHSLLAEQIGSQLRNRVLQEIELLTERLRCSPSKSRETMVVRKLTRSEWDSIRSSGLISQPGALAILVVPPVQKSTLIRAQQQQDHQLSDVPPYPLCQLYPNVTIPGPSSTIDLQPPLSPNMVPMYNSVALFPSALSRHELHQRLQTLLTVERKARWRQKLPTSSQPSVTQNKDSEGKSSHAYIILADHDTVQRSDSVPLAIALWRLRLWDGAGRDASKGNYGGWAANQA